jgi:hypothetical protein
MCLKFNETLKVRSAAFKDSDIFTALEARVKEVLDSRYQPGSEKDLKKIQKKRKPKQPKDE